MTAASLFFFDNRLERGVPVRSRNQRVPVERAFGDALQLLNAAFHCKWLDRMPDQWSPDDLRETADHRLFLLSGKNRWIDFDESVILDRLYRSLRLCILRRKADTESRPLTELMMNYPRTFSESVEKLQSANRSLMHARRDILDCTGEPDFDTRYLSWRFSLSEGKPDTLVTVFPANHVGISAMRAMGFPGGFLGDHPPVSFGSYRRFVNAHEFLAMPDGAIGDGMPSAHAVALLERHVMDGFQWSDQLRWSESAATMDAASLALFRWLGAHFDFKLAILADSPESVAAHHSEPDVSVWDPDRPYTLMFYSGVMSHFTWMSHLGQLLQRPDLGLGRLSCLVEGGACDEKQAPVEPSAVELSLAAAVEDGQTDDLKRLIAEIETSPFRHQWSFHAGQRGDTGIGAGLLHFAAGRFELAADTLMEPGHRERAISLVRGPLLESLYECGRFEAVRALCDEQEWYPDIYHLVQYRLGLTFDPARLAGLYKLEYLLLSHDLDGLHQALEQLGDRAKTDPQYMAYLGEWAFTRDPIRARQLLEQALELTEQQQDRHQEGLIRKRLGNLFFRLRDYVSAEAHYLEAMDIFADLGNRFHHEAVSYNMALVAIHLCKLDIAEDVLVADLKRNRESGDTLHQVYNLKSLAKIEAYRGNCADADRLLVEAGTLSREHNFLREIPGVHYMRGHVAVDSGDFNLAEQEIERLEQLTEKQEKWREDIRFLKASLLLRQARYDELDVLLDEISAPALHPDDRLFLRVLRCLSRERSAGTVLSCYEDLGSAEHVHTRVFSRSLLLERYPGLLRMVSPRSIRDDYAAVRTYNPEMTESYRKYTVASGRQLASRELTELMTRLIRHGREREPASFHEVLAEIGEWLGVGRLTVSSDADTVPEDRSLIVDERGKVALLCELEPDDDIRSELRMIVSCIAAVGIPRTVQSVIEIDRDSCPFLSLIKGRSAPVVQLKNRIRKAASFHFPVLITGESGTGKELTARAVHECSPRKGRPFLAVNCAALPESLIESELFGHVRGAFTGAQVTRAGLLESAGSGTVFLDEIGEMPLTTQAKLLRVLQEKEYFRLGESKPRKVDARFVFATNRKLEAAIEDGSFREDLYFRITGFRIDVPSLNDRREDVGLLARHFLEQLEGGRGKELSPSAEALVQSHQFRGNIRELQNMMMAAIVNVGDAVEIEPEHLPDYIRPVKQGYAGELKQATRAFQRDFVKDALEQTGYNNSRSARLLGLSRQRVIQLRKELGLQ